MSSLRNLLSITALGLLSLPSANALPQNVVTTTVTVSNCEATGVSHALNAPTLTLPLNGGPTELPAPLSNLTLKYITLGRGFQNYTCSNPSSAPVALGAVATLFDFTNLALIAETTLNVLPPAAVNVALPTPSATADIVGEAMYIPGIGTFPAIGEHFFKADGTPTFHLSATNEILFGAKVGDIKAPADAAVGPMGTGAVDWLDLTDKGDSVGIHQVYRVVTAGGNPPANCSAYAAGTVITVPYASEYWFFG